MNIDSGELWSFMRKVLSQGGDIWLDHREKSHEHYAIRLDAAARERADELEKLCCASEPGAERNPSGDVSTGAWSPGASYAESNNMAVTDEWKRGFDACHWAYEVVEPEADRAPKCAKCQDSGWIQRTGARDECIDEPCGCKDEPEPQYASVHVISVPWCQCCAVRVAADHVCECELPEPLCQHLHSELLAQLNQGRTRRQCNDCGEEFIVQQSSTKAAKL